jgi:hypothetical protein
MDRNPFFSSERGTRNKAIKVRGYQKKQRDTKLHNKDIENQTDFESGPNPD